MQELPRSSWGCVHKCSLCAYVPSESKCASPSAHPCLWPSCGTVRVQVLFCLWLHCLLQEHSKEGDGYVIEWFNWTVQRALKVCQAWGLPLFKKWINSSIGEPQQTNQTQTCANIDWIMFQETQTLRLRGSKTVGCQNYAVHWDCGDVKCWHEQGLL